MRNIGSFATISCARDHEVAAARMLVKSKPVNWLPWSVVKISGWPERAGASLSAAPQNDVSIVFDSGDRPIHDRHGKTAPMTPKTRGKRQE